jgi:hypothetical protein
MIDRTTITIEKLDAAKRQLQTAIRLWFDEGDPVSIHTLAFAAYEIAHVVSKKHNRHRYSLLFDAFVVPEENRAAWNIAIKKHAGFFKHANKDWDASIKFAPAMSIVFMIGAGAGLRLAGEPHSLEELALLFWLLIHKPEWINSDTRKLIQSRIPVKHLMAMKTIPKQQFLEAIKMGTQKG